MSVHIHTMRDRCASALILVPAVLLLGWSSAPESKEFELVQVSGRVTCADQPLSGAIYFLSDDVRRPSAMGIVNPDGSFQLYVNGDRNRLGVVPGTYRVVVLPGVLDKTGSRVDSKCQNLLTTNLLVHVEPDWKYANVNLH
jgi:hypothetical protein